jgi:hypothetical protein
MSSDDSDTGDDYTRNVKTAPWRSIAFSEMLASMDTWHTYLRSKRLVGTPGHPGFSRIRFHNRQLIGSTFPKGDPRTVYDDTWYGSHDQMQRSKLGAGGDIEIPVIVSTFVVHKLYIADYLVSRNSGRATLRCMFCSIHYSLTTCVIVSKQDSHSCPVAFL